MKSLRLAALAGALTLAAACSSAPTEPALLDSAAPSFDGGNTLGSGKGVGTMGSGGGTGSSTMEDGGGSLGSGNMNTDSAGTAERGPGMVGSGN